MKSLRSNLHLYFFIFAVFPLLIGSSVILYKLYNAKLDSIFNRQFQILKLVEHDTNKFIDNIEYLGEYVKDKYLIKKHNLLTGLIRVQRDISSIYILNNDGKLKDFSSNIKVNIFKGYDLSNMSYFQAIKNGADSFWSEVDLLYGTNRPSITYSIRIDKDTIAVLTIDLSILNEFASKFKSSYNQVKIIRIVDNNGKFLAHPAQKNFVSQRKNILHTNLYKEFISKGLSYRQIFFKSIAKKDKIGIYGITKNNWYIIIAEDKELLLNTFYQLLFFVLLFSLALVLISFLFAMKLSKYILTPIETIGTNMDLFVQKGSVSNDIKTNYKELSSLVNSFNTMIYKIEEQTIKLTNKNKELEASQKIAKLGSWSYNLSSYQFNYSKEIVHILENQNNQEALSYQKFLNFIHPDDKQLFLKEYEKGIQSKQPYSLKHRLILKENNIKWVKHFCEIKFDEDGKPLYLLGSLQDITNEHNKDQLLAEQSKLASMGEMIGNIAHQWRQPLSIISTVATGLQLQKQYKQLSDEEFNNGCTLINDNAQYLSRTIDDFRNFIKGDREKIRFKINETIESFLHLVEGSIKNHQINVIYDLKEPIELEGYPNELTQCFINLYNNAKDAFEKEQEDKYLFIDLQTSNNSLIIKFKDNAGGIKKDIINRIFEPYFTTKHQSIGTGLGLSMTRNIIVDGMNGSIEVSNQSYQYKQKNYQGAEFIITLPLNG